MREPRCNYSGTNKAAVISGQYVAVYLKFIVFNYCLMGITTARQAEHELNRDVDDELRY